MALEKLLENEARSEIERIRAEARDRAALIVRQAQEQAQDMLQSRQRVLDAQAQASSVRARSAAELEVNAARLNAGEQGIQRAFELARGELVAVTRVPEYQDIMARLIAEARLVVPQAAVVEVNPSEVDVARAIATDLEVRANPQLQGGIRLISKDGKSSVTNTLLARLERLRESLAPQISRLLSEG